MGCGQRDLVKSLRSRKNKTCLEGSIEANRRSWKACKDWRKRVFKVKMRAQELNLKIPIRI